MKAWILILFALWGVSWPVFADRLALPAKTPSSFKNECGGCHLAFSPALLAAKDWQKTMAGLQDHFGTDAAVNAEIGPEITSFLTQNAGKADKLGSAGEPPRITQTARFVRKHRKVASRIWRDPRVKSAANCEACHRNAAVGSFSEREIRLPDGVK